MTDRDRAIGIIDVAQNCMKAYRLWKTDRIIDTVVAGLLVLVVLVPLLYGLYSHRERF